jgi:4-hydroxy-2-oxoheptanedioate aldolase
MRPNKLKQIWASGKAANNCWLMLSSAIAAEQLAHQGWDSLTVDQEHGQADHAGMVAMFTAISTTDAAPLVRVKWNDPGDIMRALDSGAYGVICPMIETRADCEKFVGACRYPPLGYRSYGPRRAAIYAGADYAEHANDTVLAIAQIESRKGMENIDAIAAVAGLDMLYLGPNDLRLTLGLKPRPRLEEPEILAAADTLVAAAHKAGLRAGIFCSNADDALAMIGRGFDLVTAVIDDGLLAGGTAIRQRFS